MSLLDHAQDHYGGVIIHAEGLPTDAEAFDASLKTSLQASSAFLRTLTHCHVERDDAAGKYALESL